jgi:N-glycosylase/DNA lyase
MQINLDHTINSGQVFLWQRLGDSWYGIDGQNVICAGPSGVRSYRRDGSDFFRTKDDFAKISEEISRDGTIRKGVRRFPGLRLLRQDPFQCYISFITSANSNIQNIRLSLSKIAERFGKKVTFDGIEFHLFPTPDGLAGASRQELRSCGLGYRTDYVYDAARAADSGEVDFAFLKKTDYHTAKSELLKISGIGNKVADCILLFSLEKMEAFPLDRWIIRSLQEYYPKRFSFEGKALTDKKYRLLHDELVDYFGPYAGYSQQFLFKMIRDSNQKRWV